MENTLRCLPALAGTTGYSPTPVNGSETHTAVLEPGYGRSPADCIFRRGIRPHKPGIGGYEWLRIEPGGSLIRSSGHSDHSRNQDSRILAPVLLETQRLAAASRMGLAVCCKSGSFVT